MRPEIELSIVIPTLNEEQSILRTLENLSGQKDLQFEVIISDGGSTDNTCVEAISGQLQYRENSSSSCMPTVPSVTLLPSVKGSTS
jgi:glycosyltransferase involved in cell wall biosynthesis